MCQWSLRSAFDKYHVVKICREGCQQMMDQAIVCDAMANGIKSH